MKWRALLAGLMMLCLIPTSVAAQGADREDDGEVLVRVNGSDRVEEDESLEVVVIVDGDLEISGAVEEVTVVVRGDVTVLDGGLVNGRLVVVDGTLTLRDGSTTNADVYLADDSSWVQEEGAVITGDVRQGSFAFDLDGSDAWQLALLVFVAWVGSTLVAVLVALVFAGIGGRQLWESAGNLSRRLGATVVTTLAFWFGLVLIMTPLALSGIGAVLIPVLIIAGMAIWYLGYIAFGTRLGALMTGRRMDDALVSHPYLSAIAGTLLLQIILLVALAIALSGALVAALRDNSGGLGLIFGAPALILFFLLWLAGIIGGGALVLKAVQAWSADEA